jgi:tetratricopeptide (TPR) repeat protein
MTPATAESPFPAATSGAIAVLNHQSARRRAWARLWQAPEHPGLAEAVVEQEDIAARFLGDVTALDRLRVLADRLETVEAPPAHVPLVLAQIASMEHRFADADGLLDAAVTAGAPLDAVHRLKLAVDQACGRDLDLVLEVRRQSAEATGSLEDLVPLGALLADLRQFEAADDAYLQGLRGYGDVSPFALAWVCFQLGRLWGEVAADPDAERAARWYRQALSYLPAYAKARIHLAEILTEEGRIAEAEALLVAIIDTGDPEVHWRLAEVCSARGDEPAAARHMDKAHALYAALIGKHPLAYADHGAEFYLAGGNDPHRALDLARLNLANRPSLRAFEQALNAANAAGDRAAASEIRAACRERWGAQTLGEAHESEGQYADSP